MPWLFFLYYLKILFWGLSWCRCCGKVEFSTKNQYNFWFFFRKLDWDLQLFKTPCRRAFRKDIFFCFYTSGIKWGKGIPFPSSSCKSIQIRSFKNLLAFSVCPCTLFCTIYLLIMWFFGEGSILNLPPRYSWTTKETDFLPLSRLPLWRNPRVFDWIERVSSWYRVHWYWTFGNRLFSFLTRKLWQILWQLGSCFSYSCCPQGFWFGWPD